MALQPPPVPPDPKKGLRPPPAPTSTPPEPQEPAMIADAGATALEPEMNFWQHPFVQQVLPFLTSLVLHVSLILLGYLTMRAAKEMLADEEKNKPKEEEVAKLQAQPIEADMSHMLEQPQTNLRGFAGLGNDPTRRAEQANFPDVPPDAKGTAERPGTAAIPQMGGDGGGADFSGVIGSGGAGGMMPGGGVKRGGGGDGDGSGRDMAPFGTPGGGGGGVGFIKSQDVAKKICYVCDASGSMMTMFDDLRAQIAISVGNLAPIQTFNVIFFQDKGCGSLDKVSLLPATPDNKRKAETFLTGVTPRSGTDPIPALELAATLKPEVIFLLTDGDFEGPGNDAVIKWCKEKFSDGRTRINTIAFVSKEYKDNPQDLEFVKALQEIAKNSGGSFKHVSDEDMQQR